MKRNPLNIRPGDTVRWDRGSRDPYTVTQVGATGFCVLYSGKDWFYTFGAPVEVVQRAPRAITPQAQVVLNHMQRAGSITQREALVDHAVQSLTRRITEIKDACIPVKTEYKRHPVTGQRYARYFLG